MDKRQLIEEFFAQKTFAVVGASADKRRFGNAVFTTFIDRELTATPINPKYDAVEGRRCYPSISAMPYAPEAAIVVTSPRNSLNAVKDAAAAGVSYVWFQKGSESKEAVEFAEIKKMKVITNHCVIMYAAPVKGGHKIHRTLVKWFGGLYK